MDSYKQQIDKTNMDVTQSSMRDKHVSLPSERRIPLDRSEIKAGDIVAFDAGYGPAVAIMESGNWFTISYNYYPKHDNGLWYQDEMPEEIQLYAPTHDDMLLAIDHLITTDEATELYNDLGTNTLCGMDAYLKRAIGEVDTLFRQRAQLQERIISRFCDAFNEEKERLEQSLAKQETTIWDQAKTIEDLKEELLNKEVEIAKLKDEIARLKKVKTEDDFVKRLLKVTKKLFKNERSKADGIRQVMDKLERDDAEANLDAWIEGRELSPTIIQPKEYVATKIVDTEIQNVEAGGTGVNKEYHKN